MNWSHSAYQTHLHRCVRIAGYIECTGVCRCNQKHEARGGRTRRWAQTTNGEECVENTRKTAQYVARSSFVVLDSKIIACAWTLRAHRIVDTRRYAPHHAQHWMNGEANNVWFANIKATMDETSSEMICVLLFCDKRNRYRLLLRSTDDRSDSSICFFVAKRYSPTFRGSRE